MSIVVSDHQIQERLLHTVHPANKQAREASMDLPDDEFLSLEERMSAEALAWVEVQNAKTTHLTDTETFEALQSRWLSTYHKTDKLPNPEPHGDYIYNVWRDENHIQGLLRRATVQSYCEEQTVWDTVLDLDALSAQEGIQYIWKGQSVLHTNPDISLLYLSPEGGRACIKREYNMAEKTFVSGGFQFPLEKGAAVWMGPDTLCVASESPKTGGRSTDSGYPCTVRKWQRGQSLAEAEVIFEVPATHVSVSVGSLQDSGISITDHVSFGACEWHILFQEDKVPKQMKIPDTAMWDVSGNRLLVHLVKPWKTTSESFGSHTLLTSNFKEFLAGEANLEIVYKPGPSDNSILHNATYIGSRIVVELMQDVNSKLLIFSKNASSWQSLPMPGVPDGSIVGIWEASSDKANSSYLLSYENALTPRTICYGVLPYGHKPVKSSPRLFDSTDMTISQHFAASKDGTRIPYFQIGPKLPAPSSPTILYAYGGFGHPVRPYYNAALGASWLERGYTYASANIRGGSEYGPQWHEAAKKGKRHKSEEDLEAVAMDLCTRITVPSCLGLMGASNGGLLVANVMMKNPELCAAVSSSGPLLDMVRYKTMPPGASWASEYPDPDLPEEHQDALSLSAYHKEIQSNNKYPSVLLTTSTNDDVVHPGHARKMAAKLNKAGIRTTFFEQTSGGHSGMTNATTMAHSAALKYTFFLKELCKGEGGAMPIGQLVPDS